MVSYTCQLPVYVDSKLVEYSLAEAVSVVRQMRRVADRNKTAALNGRQLVSWT